jgi:hypothetical protein
MTDLSATLMMQGAFAARMADRVPRALQHPAIRRHHVQCLAQILMRHSLATDQLLVELRLQRADPAAVKAAQSIQQLWTAVLTLVERRLAEGESRRVHAVPFHNNSMQASA